MYRIFSHTNINMNKDNLYAAISARTIRGLKQFHGVILGIAYYIESDTYLEFPESFKYEEFIDHIFHLIFKFHFKNL